MSVRDGNFVLLAISTSSKINRREKNCGRCGLTASFLCCYLNLPYTARREPMSVSSVSLPITRTEMSDPWPPLFHHAIYLSPAIAYSIAREPLARVVPGAHDPRFASVSLIRVSCVSSCVSRPCPGKPHFGLPRYFNELIVIGTLSRSHESFLWYVPLCRAGLPQNVPRR